MKTQTEYLVLVMELNSDLYNHHGDVEEQWFYTSSGYVDVIGYGDKMLWNSENCDRKWIEKINDYEPMKPYLKRKLKDYGTFLKKISK